MTYVFGILIIGIIFLATYYYAWTFFVDKAIEYLQNGNQRISKTEFPESFAGYDTIPKRDQNEVPDGLVKDRRIEISEHFSEDEMNPELFKAKKPESSHI